MADKRIIEQVASTELYNDDYLIKDSALHGTTKISQSKLKELFLDGTLTLEDLSSASAWTTNTYYDRDSVVYHDGKLYRNLSGKRLHEASFSTDDWTEIASDFVKMINNLQDSMAGGWMNTQTYYQGDYAFYNGHYYRCVSTTTPGTWQSNKWMQTSLHSEIIQYLWKFAQYMDISSQSSLHAYRKGELAIRSIDHVDHLLMAKEDYPQGVTSFDPDQWIDLSVDDEEWISGLSKTLVGMIDDVSSDIPTDASGLSYDNTDSGLEADDVQEAIDEVVTDIESVETALETKADVDGFYDELYAGNLVTDMHTADNKPYLYRQSPSASSVSQNIVGGTVAWNQLAYSGNGTTTIGGVTFTRNNDNSYTLDSNGAPAGASAYRDIMSAIKIPVGHIIYLAGCPSGGSTTDGYFGLDPYEGTAKAADVGDGRIYKKSTQNCTYRLYVIEGATVSNKTFKPTIIDLTQAFGSTIADYIYSLEQATAGSGIAWLKSNGFLTKDYYPYDSGSLQSVKTSGRKIVGKNIASVNSVTAGSGSVDIYNGIGIQSNITISFKCNNFSFTNAGASLVVIIDNNNQAHPVTPSGFGLSANIVYNNRVSATYNLNYKFIRLFIPTTGYTNISGSLDDIQIELGSTATDYEPYNPTTYPLSPIDLRGIPKLDSNNQLYFDGDVYSADGSVTRKYGIVDLGTATWGYTNGRFYYNPTNAKVRTQQEMANLLCIKYPTNQYLSQPDNSISSYAGYIYVRADSFNGDVTDFKTAMNGVYLVYELTTSTSETADTYENPQLVGSTEEFIDTRDVPIPVGGERKYYTDLKAKLEELAKIPDVPSTNGTYTLKATRSASGVTYSWVSG